MNSPVIVLAATIAVLASSGNFKCSAGVIAAHAQNHKSPLGDKNVQDSPHVPSMSAVPGDRQPELDSYEPEHSLESTSDPMGKAALPDSQRKNPSNATTPSSILPSSIIDFASICSIISLLGTFFALYDSRRTAKSISKTANDLRSIMDDSRKTADDLHSIRDSLRKSLSSFEDIFAHSYKMIKECERELIYVNFVYSFGVPHKSNDEIRSGYSNIAKTLGLEERNYEDAVDDFHRALEAKILKLTSVRAAFLSMNNLNDGLYASLQDDLRRVCQTTEEYRRNLLLNRRSEFRGDVIISQVPHMPYQMIICRSKSVVTGQPTNCGLIFLVGDEEVKDGRLPKHLGFYTEVEDNLELHKRLAHWLVKNGKPLYPLQGYHTPHAPAQAEA